MSWFDSHCHIPPDRAAEVIDTARRAGVERLVTVGTDAPQSQAALDVAGAHQGVWATVGLHPHDAKNGVETILPLLEKSDDCVVAVGECGLDYHYDYSPRAVQREAFSAQVAIAKERGLALVIHSREAWDDTFAVLEAEGTPERTVFHCFTGGPDEAGRALDLGAHLSFSGIITFKGAEDVRAAAALCPLDRLMVETDSPYLAPVPHRGRSNQPAWVPLVGDAVAKATGSSIEDVEEASWSAANSLFGLRDAPVFS